MKATKNGLAIQITTDENEKQKEKLAADQFFSSLLDFGLAPLRMAALLARRRVQFSLQSAAAPPLWLYVANFRD